MLKDFLAVINSNDTELVELYLGDVSVEEFKKDVEDYADMRVKQYISFKGPSFYRV